MINQANSSNKSKRGSVAGGLMAALALSLAAEHARAAEIPAGWSRHDPVPASVVQSLIP